MQSQSRSRHSLKRTPASCHTSTIPLKIQGKLDARAYQMLAALSSQSSSSLTERKGGAEGRDSTEEQFLKNGNT